MKRESMRRGVQKALKPLEGCNRRNRDSSHWTMTQKKNKSRREQEKKVQQQQNTVRPSLLF